MAPADRIKQIQSQIDSLSKQIQAVRGPEHHIIGIFVQRALQNIQGKGNLVLSNSQFGRYTGARAPRQVALTLRVQF